MGKIQKSILKKAYKKRDNKIWASLYRHYVSNPNVVINDVINGQKCIVPYVYSGTYFSDKFKQYDKQLGRICVFLKNKMHKKLNILDVGANIGDTVLNIGDKDNRYLLVEGEKTYSRFIKRNLREYEYVLVDEFCGEYEEESKEKRIILDHGTASIVKGGDTSINVTTIDAIVCKNKFEVDVLKTDTDGFDFKVLRGAESTIKQYKPVIFFEWSAKELIEGGEDPLSIFNMLMNNGYGELILFDNYGNLFQRVKTNEYQRLKDAIDYSMNQVLYYYDVCAIHENSVIKIDELWEFLASY